MTVLTIFGIVSLAFLNNFHENYLNSTAICQVEFRKDLKMPETAFGYCVRRVVAVVDTRRHCERIVFYFVDKR